MTPVDFPAGIGPALGAELARQGVRWATINGVLHVSDEVAFATVVGSFNQADGEKPAKIAEVKAEAQRRIYLVAPQWKQANLTARAAELALQGGPANAQEIAEMAAGVALWTRIKALRVASNAIEAEIGAMTDAQDVVTFDPLAADWPE